MLLCDGAVGENQIFGVRLKLVLKLGLRRHKLVSGPFLIQQDEDVGEEFEFLQFKLSSFN